MTWIKYESCEHIIAADIIKGFRIEYTGEYVKGVGDGGAYRVEPMVDIKYFSPSLGYFPTKDEAESFVDDLIEMMGDNFGIVDVSDCVSNETNQWRERAEAECKRRYEEETNGEV